MLGKYLNNIKNIFEKYIFADLWGFRMESDETDQSAFFLHFLME